MTHPTCLQPYCVRYMGSLCVYKGGTDRYAQLAFNSLLRLDSKEDLIRYEREDSRLCSCPLLHDGPVFYGLLKHAPNIVQYLIPA